MQTVTISFEIAKQIDTVFMLRVGRKTKAAAGNI